MTDFLSEDTLAEVIRHAPQVCLDLVIVHGGSMLLGLRNNEPMKGCWWAPGGRVRKAERLADAFQRISADELGVSLPFSHGHLLGAFEHFFESSRFGDFPTHNVTLAYLVEMDSRREFPASDQHAVFEWPDLADVLTLDKYGYLGKYVSSFPKKPLDLK